jgi:predicted P-loop ATPase
MKENRKALVRADDTAAKQFLTKHVEWPEVGKQGAPLTTSILNTAALLREARRPVRFNTFANRIEVQLEGTWVPLEDHHAKELWAIANHHEMKMKRPDLIALVEVLARKTTCHPVREYLAGLTWDGTPRLDTWLTDYLGVVDNPVRHAFGRSTLLGAAWRVMKPGIKHDTMLVLEGGQGRDKSSAIAVLGGEWYTDGLKLGQSAKETIEQTAGSWIIEVPELAGRNKNEVETIKHQLSSQVDRARMAYGHLRSEVPRQWVAIGTTNDDKYLKDPTGNRRFLPVKTGAINLDALRRDRDQLWAEAYARAQKGETAGIPPELWAAAGAEQAERLMITPLEEKLEQWFRDLSGRITKEQIWVALGRLSPTDRKQADANAMTATMQRLGWTAKKVRPPRSEPEYGYEKIVLSQDPKWLVFYGGKFTGSAPDSATIVAFLESSGFPTQNTEQNPEQKIH